VIGLSKLNNYVNNFGTLDQAVHLMKTALGIKIVAVVVTKAPPPPSPRSLRADLFDSLHAMQL